MERNKGFCEFGPAVLSKTANRPDEGIQLAVQIKKNGKRDGADVVQVYVRKVDDKDGSIKSQHGSSSDKRNLYWATIKVQ